VPKRTALTPTSGGNLKSACHLPTSEEWPAKLLQSSCKQNDRLPRQGKNEGRTSGLAVS